MTATTTTTDHSLTTIPCGYRKCRQPFAPNGCRKKYCTDACGKAEANRRKWENQQIKQSRYGSGVASLVRGTGASSRTDGTGSIPSDGEFAVVHTLVSAFGDLLPWCAGQHRTLAEARAAAQQLAAGGHRDVRIERWTLTGPRKNVGWSTVIEQIGAHSVARTEEFSRCSA
jgi:hypothetical protein